MTRLLAKDRTDRYPDARAVGEQLAKVRLVLAPAEGAIVDAIARLDRRDAENAAATRSAEHARKVALERFLQGRADINEILEDTIARLVDVDVRFELVRPVPDDENNRTSRDWFGEKHRWIINGPHVTVTFRLWEPDVLDLTVDAGELILRTDQDSQTPAANLVYENTPTGLRWQVYQFAPNYLARTQGINPPARGDQWQGLTMNHFRLHWREIEQRITVRQWVTTEPKLLDENTIIEMIGAATSAP